MSKLGLILCSVIAAGAAACKTPGGARDSQLRSDGNAAAYSGTVLTLSGAAAKAVYDKASWEADASGAKSFTGAIDVVCTQTGNLPPGAQGFPGQIKYQCSASSHWPEGAQGFPGPAFFIIEGDAAFKFWEAFNVQAKWQGDASWYIKKHTSQNGEFRCTQISCTYGEAGGNVGGGGNRGPVLSLSGSTAKAVYDKASWEVDGAGMKSFKGAIDVVCTQTGNLPPGAQGFPGQINYQCSASSHWPEGAQGFPGPAFFIIEGEPAFKFWDAFNVQAKWQGDASWYIKKHTSQNGEFRCSKTSCTYGDSAYVGGGGGGGGEQGGVFLTLMGTPAKAVYDKASWTPDASGTKMVEGAIDVVCTQTGNLPPGAQGFPGQIKHQCSASSHWPEGAQGFPGPAYFIVEGDAAAKFWQAFQAEAQWQGEASWYIKKVTSQNGEFKCSKAGGAYTCTAR